MTVPGARRITDLVTDPASPSPEKAAPPAVLLLTNDLRADAARTSRHLALALNRIGFRALVRDTRLIRWGAQAAERDDSARREAFEAAAVAKWAKLVSDYGIELVLSLDLHWLVSKHLFVNDPNVRQVHSFWLNAVPDSLPGTPAFALDGRAMAAEPKVVHHCLNEEQAESLRHFGVKQIRSFTPGAPADYLRADSACDVRDRLAYIGDPTEASAVLVARLTQRGWLDVHGSPEAWKPFGVSAQPLSPFPRLPGLYRRYPALLNLGDDLQVVEAAACGRLSLCLDRDRLRDWRGDGEILVAPEQDALEAAAETILRDPEAALAAGERARARVARDHLWENRLKAVLA